ncbi:hypothetical protein ACVNS2_25145 [Paenibacillus caseinilyticus]|uniref:Uncharacterized protein n=1 Tax=Paenibacillus mucilaginosus K02 TaxID=997761 RepID=I0BNL4_9BACL|nr:hypothetical protein [Paenibacillus mucilaginosus]AFH63961.1 hypothetical protein B2K_25285 [Paenibacillus mucilaginosus K02]
MIYHVLHSSTRELRILTPAEVLDMDTDAAGRIVIHGADGEFYYLLADESLTV